MAASFTTVRSDPGGAVALQRDRRLVGRGDVAVLDGALRLAVGQHAVAAGVADGAAPHRSRPCSLITTAEVPKCSSVQDSMELSTAEVATMPAPARLVTRQSRIAREPLLRATRAVQAEPTMSQPSIANCPRGASMTGSSSSRPRSTGR